MALRKIRLVLCLALLLAWCGCNATPRHDHVIVDPRRPVVLVAPTPARVAAMTHLDERTGDLEAEEVTTEVLLAPGMICSFFEPDPEAE